MRRFYFFLLFCFFLHLPSFVWAIKDTVKVGVYVSSIYDLSLAEKEYSINFWVWLIYTNEKLQPEKYLEIYGAKEVQLISQEVERTNGVYWASLNYVATIQQDWETDNFPFDHQQLLLRIEDNQYDARKLVFTADKAGSNYDEYTKIYGFDITSFDIKSEKRKYKTTYGDPSLPSNGTSRYSGVTLTIDLQRDSKGLFLKLFFGVYIAFAISMLTFLVSPNEILARFELCVGGLFAAVGNKYIVDSNLPENSSFSLADQIHTSAFMGILIIILLSAIAKYLAQHNAISFARIIDRTALFLLPILFMLINWWFVKVHL